MMTRAVSSTVCALLLAGLVLPLAGCQRLGPRSIRNGRPQYNQALQRTFDEEMLLNLVRLKYNESPYFLSIISISSSMSVSVTAAGWAGTGLSDPNQSIAPGAYVNPGVTYSEDPTIIYAPLQGEAFVRRLLTPIDIGTITLLERAGWDLDRVLHVTVDSMNGIRNGAKLDRPAPARPSAGESFRAIVATMTRLEERGDLTFKAIMTAEDDARVRFEMYIAPAARSAPDVQAMFRSLQVDPAAQPYLLTSNPVGGGGNKISIVTRPLTAALFFLSQGIDVPKEHVERGLVAITRETNGQPYSWRGIVKPLLRIESSSTRPSAAFVRVPYRGAWYYIRENDTESRATFSLLALLYTLQAGARGSGTSPVLTLPIAD